MNLPVGATALFTWLRKGHTVQCGWIGDVQQENVSYSLQRVESVLRVGYGRGVLAEINRSFPKIRAE